MHIWITGIAAIVSLSNFILLAILIRCMRKQQNKKSALRELISQFSDSVKEETDDQHSDHKITVVSSDTRGSVLILSMVGAALVLAMVIVFTIVIFINSPQTPEEAWTYSVFGLALFSSLGFLTYLATNTMEDETSF